MNGFILSRDSEISETDILVRNMEFHSVTICGLERQLPLSYIGKSTRLANFSFLGDVELVDAVADALAARIDKTSLDVFVCPQVKVVPLVHGIAKRFGHKRFVVCRKSVRPYMIEPIVLIPLPHFPKHIKKLVINGPDVEFLKGKRVFLIDDVISTGVTMRMLRKLMSDVGATVTGAAVVLKQGDKPFEPIDEVLYLADIPIFPMRDEVLPT